MHELALCDALLRMVRDISREEALDGVRSITVRVGTLSGVVPRFLTDCWTAVTDGTEYDGVPLRVETEAGRARWDRFPTDEADDPAAALRLRPAESP